MAGETLHAPSRVVKIPNGDHGVEYREVAGWPGYAVGDDGSVWSALKQRPIGRALSGRIAGTQSYISGEWTRKCIQENWAGYKMVGLGNNGVQKLVAVHLLVLVSFLGPRPSRRHHACHTDGDKSNNYLTNLRWDTPEANQADRALHGTAIRGEAHPRATISESTAIEIIRRIRAGERTISITAALGVSHHIVNEIRRRRRWLWLWEK